MIKLPVEIFPALEVTLSVTFGPLAALSAAVAGHAK